MANKGRKNTNKLKRKRGKKFRYYEGDDAAAAGANGGKSK